MEEIWKDFEYGNMFYQGSTKGNLRSLDYNRSGMVGDLHPYTSNCGYLGIVLSGRKHASVHRIIAELFIPNPENKKTVNHKNGIKIDNCVENLEWLSHKENKRHSFDVLHVKTCKGTKKLYKNGHPNQKLTIELVKIIKEKLKDGQYGIDIAWEFSLNQMTISRIKTNKIWKHITI